MGCGGSGVSRKWEWGNINWWLGGCCAEGSEVTGFTALRCRTVGRQRRETERGGMESPPTSVAALAVPLLLFSLHTLLFFLKATCLFSPLYYLSIVCILSKESDWRYISIEILFSATWVAITIVLPAFRSESPHCSAIRTPTLPYIRRVLSALPKHFHQYPFKMDTSSLSATEMAIPSTKRKRSPSADTPTPPVKAAKTHSNHLQINYLARQSSDILPLISTDEPLPTLLSTISNYDGVLQRHESMAGNLGAKPLGPMLIKRFERLFDGPPRVLKSHGKEGTSVGWLDVVDFARNKPEQFNLEKSRDGVRVCQFYTKQSRVEITEEDYELIASGMPQKLIPPQPIVEDEEKELGTLEILEKRMAQVVQLADQGESVPP